MAKPTFEQKEVGLMFMGWCIRAIIAGTKTQTRRRINLKGDQIVDLFDDSFADQGVWHFDTKKYHNRAVKCRYGKKGDRIWCRETFTQKRDPETDLIIPGEWLYKADLEIREVSENGKIKTEADLYKWKGSMVMPRVAGRLFPEIEAVRAEPVNVITEADAIKEGVKSIAEYKKVWIEMHGADSWRSDWVWVIDFKKLEMERNK